MSQKNLKFFVFGLFGVIGILFFITKSKESDVFKEIKQADLTTVENVKFYRDFLRNDGGELNVPNLNDQEVEELLDILKRMDKATVTLKSLEVEMLYRIRMNLKVKKNRTLIINVYRCVETGDVGQITIDQGENLISSGGEYHSAELLEWVENMKLKDGYEDIGGAY